MCKNLNSIYFYKFMHINLHFYDRIKAYFLIRYTFSCVNIFLVPQHFPSQCCLYLLGSLNKYDSIKVSWAMHLIVDLLSRGYSEKNLACPSKAAWEWGSIAPWKMTGLVESKLPPSLAPYFLPSLKWIQEKVNVINLDVNRLQWIFS